MTEDLEREGLIKRLPADAKKVKDSVVHAHRDLGTARHIIATDHDWAYTIAYNAVLQAGRALMFSKGFRPDGANQHIAVVKFCSQYLTEQDAIMFDRMRRKRNTAVYESAGFVSETEATNALRHAEDLIRHLEELIRKQ